MSSKKLLCLLLSLLLLFPVVGCAGEKQIALVKDGAAEFSVVLPKSASAQVLYARDKLAFYLQGALGVALPEGNAQATYQLLLGDTDQPESAELKKELGENEYAVRVVQDKIVIVAANDAFLYDAVVYLTEQKQGLLEADAAQGTLLLAANTDVREKGNLTSLRYLFTQKERVTATSVLQTYLGYPEKSIRATQGGCSDGTYYYQAFIQRDDASNQENNIVKIGKFDMKKQKALLFSEELLLHHANDITYNSKTGELVLAHNAPHSKRLSIIDPETLTVKRTVELPGNIYSITYSPERDQYMVGASGGQNMRLITSDFQYADDFVRLATSQTSSYTTQGICSDDTFIYHVLWDSKRSKADDFQNVITVYDWYGNFVGIIHINFGVLEPENISVIDGVFYIVAYYSSQGGALFRTEVKK